jgi:multiple sugar transport system substrate-binding protein
MGGALAACSVGATTPPAAQSTASGTVEMWYGGLGQSFIDAYTSMAKSLNEKNPKITVNVGLADTIHEKIIVVAAAGTPPDAFNIQLIDALTLLPKGIYEPLDASIKTRRYDLKALWPGLPEQYQYNGKQLVMWAQTTTTITHYNVDLLRANGLPLPADLAAQNKWTWEAALDLAQKLTKEGLYGFWTLTTPQALQPWLWMNGGRGFDSEEKPTKLTMSEPATLAAMQWQADIRNRYRVAPTPRQVTSDLTNPQAGFSNGKLAMYTEQGNIDAVNNAVQNGGKFKWDAAPLPAGSKGTFGFIGGQSIGVCAGAKNKDAALDWLFWVTSPEGQIEVVKRNIGVPTIRSMMDTPEFKAADTKAAHATTAVQAMMKVSRPIAKTTTWRTLATNVFNMMITGMNNGDIAAREACAQIDDVGTKTLLSG